MDEWYPESGRRGRISPRGKRRIKRLAARIVIISAFLAFVIAAAYFVNKGIDWYHVRATTTTTVAAHGAAVKVTVNPGMTASEIGRLLEREGVIDSSAGFVDLVKTRGSEEKLLPGIYRFYEDQQLLEVVDMLERGDGSPSFKLTIQEGLAVSQVGDLLTEDGNIPGTKYVELSGEPEKFVVPDVGGTTPEVTTLEGLLFPSTYYLIEGDGATELIGAQLAAFEAKTASLPWENTKVLGLTPYQIVTVASLIEKEASIAEERALVAAVIYNRLKADMTLGIDATVRYAVDKWTGALTEEDLATVSPYNTRIVKGLPPTPIASPGVAALEAALAPADVDYLYYVLSDTDGHHFFTADYEEFLAAKENQPEQ
jgi:UPF0755 protein